MDKQQVQKTIAKPQEGTMSELAYWTCKIGPVKREDSPLRKAVQTVFIDTFRIPPHELSSGWGQNYHDEHARLGLATTRELLEELKTRGEVSATVGEYPEEMGDMAIGAAWLMGSLPGSMLDYRTVHREN